MMYTLFLTMSILHASNGFCFWANWMSWSLCTETCGGGVQFRQKTLSAFGVCILDSNTNLNSPTEERYCNTVCLNGGTFKTNNMNGFCRCQVGHNGDCCQHDVSCGSPGRISNGHVVGNEFTIGKTVHYMCNEGFNMTNSRDADRTCTQNAYWTGRLPVCQYAVSCKSNPCKNGAICTDTLGGYNCTCSNGWTGKTCEIDIQPPVLDSCPDDILVTTSNMTHTQMWQEPSFTDPFGGEVIMTKNYQNSTFTFPWGNYTVQYSAVKPSNGLMTECKFSIAIQPHACGPIEVPEHGILVCNGWQTTYTNICKLFCKRGFAYPSGFSETDWYNCAASGHWFPKSRMSNCVSADLRMKGSMLSRFDCHKNDTGKAVTDFYLSELKHSVFKSLCDKHTTECMPENVDIQC